MKRCVKCSATGRCFHPGTLVSSNIKNDHHDINEILPKAKTDFPIPVSTDGKWNIVPIRIREPLRKRY